MPFALPYDLKQILFSLLDVDQRSFATQPDSRVDKFLAYWAGLATARGAYPGRTDLDPIGMDVRLLPNLFIVEILKSEDGRHRFRYRLLGATIIEFELAKAGKHLDEITNRDVSDIEQHYEAAANGCISLRRSNLGWLEEALSGQSYSVVVLPLADDGKVPTHLLGLCLYDGYET